MDWGIYSSSEDEQQDSSSEYPQRDPPQSSLTRSPDLVIPYRSHEHEEELERSDMEERVESDRELREEPVEDGQSKSESLSSSRVVSEKRLVRSPTVAGSRAPYSVSRMTLVACGDTGFGDCIWDMERGRPLGMSVEAARASRREDEEEECLLWDLSLSDLL